MSERVYSPEPHSPKCGIRMFPKIQCDPAYHEAKEIFVGLPFRCSILTAAFIRSFAGRRIDAPGVLEDVDSSPQSVRLLPLNVLV